MAVEMLNSTVTELASYVNSTQAALTQCTNNSNTIAKEVNTVTGNLEEARIMTLSNIFIFITNCRLKEL